MHKTLLLTFFWGICMLLCAQQVLAAFSLSASPYEGGYDLRFGKVTLTDLRINKEVTFRITTDLGRQYRLTQVLLDPLTNAQGRTIPNTNFRVYTLRGSNATGTLSLDSESQVNNGSMVLYTSNSGGDSDSFIVVYGLNNPQELEPGRYTGRLSYSLEAIDSSQTPQLVTLNVSAEIDIESHIEVSTYTGSKVIALKYGGLDQKAAYPQAPQVTINIKGNLGSQYRITQLSSDLIKSAEGEELPKGSLVFSLEGGNNGKLAVLTDTLSNQPQVIYTSAQNGASDSLGISFSLGDAISKAKQGKYRGNITYLVEGNIVYPKGGLLETLQIEADIEPIFNLVVNTSTGGSLEFPGLKPNQSPRQNIVTLEVKTNLRRPYQIIQEVAGPLTEKGGKAIGDEYFTLKTEGETSGALRYSDKTSVKKGQTILYVSDKEGSPVNFKVVYELTVPQNLLAGNYSTAINYSLLEI